MKSRLVLAAVASMMIVGSPAFAQGRGGGQPGGQVGGRVGNPDAGIRGRGGASDSGVQIRSDTRINSRIPVRASDRAVERANENAALADRSGTRTELRGVTRGLTVQRPNGMTIGTIVGVNRSDDGVVRSVVVRLADSRRVITLPRDALTLNGDVVVVHRPDRPRER